VLKHSKVLISAGPLRITVLFSTKYTGDYSHPEKNLFETAEPLIEDYAIVYYTMLICEHMFTSLEKALCLKSSPLKGLE
jgi:hypothetical protein